MQTKKAVSLVLDDGHVFKGYSFGYEKAVNGEVVFNTAMMGYPESLTDPSYSGQILVTTFPLVGNYGVPSMSVDVNGLSCFYESEKIHVRALVVSDYSQQFSHWNAERSLADWLKSEQVVGIEGIDTRELTKLLREKGSMKGKIVFDGGEDIPFEDPNLVNQVAIVSTREVKRFGNGSKRVCLVDMGVKQNIIRCLLRHDVEITMVPWDYDFNADGTAYDGLFISNGPGDPNLCSKTVEHVREFMKTGKPIYGICMGNQILSLAAGAKVTKLKYGHRGHNQPVQRYENGKPTTQCYITSQNHGFAVDNNTIPADWEPLFINMNDGSNEGIRHKTMPWFSAQFHPEASSGPTDTEFIFSQFTSLL
ncbi:MAG: glutamine-hydrolyzing carbamoyl-phosphate synthase small subunit [Bacteroidales bacterium]|nr:glutamine-hydrolyzing carbamoyl-phosphate synthase small subunit [Candidatus Liminaster caballi]